MDSSDPDYAATLAEHILELIANDHRNPATDVVQLAPTAIYGALSIVAARIAGTTFDQFDPQQRHMQAQVLGATIASLAETIWQNEVEMCAFNEGQLH